MVSTRSHPTTFPPPSLSPSKSPSSTPIPPSPTNSTTTTTASPTKKRHRTRHSPSPTHLHPSQQQQQQPWQHTPTPLTLLWLLVSLPLVAWDTLYVFLRPHSMPGGALHSPWWTPYRLYGEVDFVYGAKAWEARVGFTAAQAGLNVVETVGYVGYLGVVGWFAGVGVGGRGKGRGGNNTGKKGVLGVRWGGVRGGWGGVACLCGFGLSVMTVGKTVLYWLNEYFSGFANIGHNDFVSLFWLWIVPNGAWLIFPSYMAYVFAKDILRGLAIASGDVSSTPAKAAMGEKDD